MSARYTTEQASKLTVIENKVKLRPSKAEISQRLELERIQGLTRKGRDQSNLSQKSKTGIPVMRNKAKKKELTDDQTTVRTINGLLKKRSKYGNKKTVVDGITFDSQREAKDWGKLLLRQKGGDIRDLVRQKSYPLECDTILVKINQHGEAIEVKLPYKLIKEYVADFFYIEVATGKRIVHDSKGMKTKSYKLKKLLMKLVYGIDILET